MCLIIFVSVYAIYRIYIKNLNKQRILTKILHFSVKIIAVYVKRRAQHNERKCNFEPKTESSMRMSFDHQFNF